MHAHGRRSAGRQHLHDATHGRDMHERSCKGDSLGEQHGAPYVAGNFAPLRSEVTAFDLEVVGRIPESLNGRFLRIGPNPIDELDLVRLVRHHWFAGQRHGARPAAARRQGRLVSQPLRSRSGRGAHLEPQADPRARRRQARRQREHEPDERRRQALRRGRGRQPSCRARLRAGQCAAHRLRRHARSRLHRPSQVRSRHGRAARARVRALSAGALHLGERRWTRDQRRRA